MKTYTAAFTGREVGAIGISSDFAVRIAAENEGAARLALYNTHEHIIWLSLVESEPTEKARASQTIAQHTPGRLRAIDGQLQCEEINEYGNWIVASCERERTAQDDANIARLALCWNSHDALIAAVQQIAAWFEAQPIRAALGGGYPLKLALDAIAKSSA